MPQKSLRVPKDIHPVLVEWGDAWAGDSLGFVEKEDAVENTSIPIISIGHLVGQNPRGLTLCREVSKQGLMRAQQFIPQGMIRKVVKLT